MFSPFFPTHALKSVARRLAFAAALISTSCRESGPEPVVLAQVDEARLTLDEVRESFPAEYEKILSREQYLDFIQRWIDDEAVYQQALKLELDRDPKIRRKLERLRRKALIEELLAREGADRDFEPDEGAMTRYFEMHRDEFRRKSPEFRYASLKVNSLKEALSLRAKVRGDNFVALAPGNPRDSGGENPSTLFRKAGEIPPCLLQEISSAKPGWLSPPLNCPDGIYLVKLLERLDEGTLIPFAEARENIGGRLAMERKDKMREAKIRQYREGASIGVNLDLIPGQENILEPSVPADSTHVQ